MRILIDISLFRHWVLITCLAVATIANATDSKTIGCARLLDGSEVPIQEGRFFITLQPQGMKTPVSTVTYTLSYTLENLGLSATDLASIFDDQDVLLVGEGFGALFATLRGAGARVTAVDPLYALSDVSDLDQKNLPASQVKMLENINPFLRTYRAHLKAGTAQQLPVQSASVSLHITHLLYSNFLLEDRSTPDYPAWFSAIDESVRVLRPGGRSINAFSYEAEDMPPILAHLEELKQRGEIRFFSVEILGTKRPGYRPENGDVIEHLPDHEFTMGRISIRK